jgi:uncharacterized membrane protein
VAHTHHAHHGDDHDGDGWSDLAADRVRRLLAVAVGAALVATVVGLVMWWPRGEEIVSEGDSAVGDRAGARVTEAEDLPCSYDPTTSCHSVVIEVTSGASAGAEGTIEHSVDAAGPAASLSAGDRIFVFDNGPDVPAESRFSFADVQRGPAIWAVAFIFAAAVVALGRWRGVLALAGLAMSFAVLLLFIFPAFLHGSSPVGVAVTGASVIAFGTLYLAHGFTVRTTVALLGTFASLTLIGVLATVFTELAELSGLASEEALRLFAFAPGLDFRGLMLAAVIIGALGVLDDVTVTQSASVWELRRASPDMTGRQLYTAGLRIGREHIAATVNTLVLAYTAAALPTLLLISQSGLSLGEVLTSEEVAVEIVQTLVGSIGLVAAVPLTTALAAWVVTRGSEPAPQPALQRPSPEPQASPQAPAPWWGEPPPAGPTPPLPPRRPARGGGRPPQSDRDGWWSQ